MKKYFLNKKSDSLLIFFTGWGCDETEFSHLETDFDVLFFYDYCNLDLNLKNFDFSKYKQINLLSFSAGVFIASVAAQHFDFKINKKIALSGNPYLFDENLGLSKTIQEVLSGITEENADEFAKNYLVKTKEEYQNFHHSKRTLKSCKNEFESLKKIYNTEKQNIKDIFNSAIIGEDDRIFDVEIQKKFYKNRLRIVLNARHSLFFRIKSFDEIIKY